MTTDTNLSALLARMLGGEHEAEADGDFDGADLDHACGNAFRKGQLTPLADAEAMVAAAVDAEREACVAICQQEAENSVNNGFPDRERGLEIAAAAIRARANGGE